ncbi:hypothetical protein ACGRHY_29285 [Streptomyces sp. HK10]|uniref:hypothetical protein n=1 Tax=Streptomyces sp. HK10 TaxID=3373255 RepID=UPI0037494B97
MIRDHHRLKGGAAQLGAAGPGLPGPFGIWPVGPEADDEDQELGHRAGDRSVGAAPDWSTGG